MVPPGEDDDLYAFFALLLCLGGLFAFAYFMVIYTR